MEMLHQMKHESLVIRSEGMSYQKIDWFKVAVIVKTKQNNEKIFFLGLYNYKLFYNDSAENYMVAISYNL